MSDEDDNTLDTPAWQTAEQIAAGMPKTDVAKREVAAELVRVREALRQIIHAPNRIRLDIGLRILCHSLDITVP